jgi:hypothetical protein
MPASRDEIEEGFIAGRLNHNLILSASRVGPAFLCEMVRTGEPQRQREFGAQCVKKTHRNLSQRFHLA